MLQSRKCTRRNYEISCEQTLHYFTSMHPQPKLPPHWVENPREHQSLHSALNKLLCMKKTLALQSINNELNSELTYQYKDSNRINTLICTLLKIFSSKTYSNCESLTERKCKRRSKKMYKTARDHLVGYCRFCFSRPVAIKQWQQQHKTRILTT